jgi:hypothetical protein
MDLARAPRRAPLTARKKGSGYENGGCLASKHPRPQAQARAALTVALVQAQRRSRQYTTMHCGFGPLYTYYQFAGAARSVFVDCRCKHISENLSF